MAQNSAVAIGAYHIGKLQGREQAFDDACEYFLRAECLSDKLEGKEITLEVALKLIALFRDGLDKLLKSRELAEERI